MQALESQVKASFLWPDQMIRLLTKFRILPLILMLGLYNKLVQEQELYIETPMFLKMRLLGEGIPSDIKLKPNEMPLIQL